MQRPDFDYALCLNSAGIVMGARKLGFEVGEVEIAPPRGCRIEAGNSLKSKMLFEVLAEKEPLGLRSILYSMTLERRMAVLSDFVTVALCGRQAVALSPLADLVESPTTARIDIGRLRACFYSFFPHVGSIASVAWGDLILRAARLIGSSWADVMWLTTLLSNNGSLGRKDLLISSPLTGFPIEG